LTAKTYSRASRTLAVSYWDSLDAIDDALLAASRHAVRTPRDRLVRADFHNDTFDGIFVKEMLVLRAA
jgi:hypothetical protein